MLNVSCLRPGNKRDRSRTEDRKRGAYGQERKVFRQGEAAEEQGRSLALPGYLPPRQEAFELDAAYLQPDECTGGSLTFGALTADMVEGFGTTCWGRYTPTQRIPTSGSSRRVFPAQCGKRRRSREEAGGYDWSDAHYQHHRLYRDRMGCRVARIGKWATIAAKLWLY